MHLNPQISSAAEVKAAGSTYHILSGRAQQILLQSDSSGCYFFFDFDTTAITNTSGTQRIAGDTPVIMNVNHPNYISILGGTTGYVYITEFI